MIDSANKILPTVLLLTVICFIANGQTNVSGFISANTTWNLAGSPYIVVGNALVSHGYTLTIDPGVTVKFNADKALQIDGELIAIGTPVNRITFTSNQPNPSPGDWAKVHFADTCVSAVFDSSGNYVSGCIMKYCDVLYGGGLGFGEIHIVNSFPYFSHCNILNSASSGIYLSGSTYLIDSSVIKDCVESGLYFSNYFYYGCGLVIQGDTFEHNGCGITFDSPHQPCLHYIKNNYFYLNTGGAIFTPSGLGNIKITENEFMSNSGSTISGLLGADIECNKFLNNQTGNGVVIEMYLPYDSGIIANNLFDGNSSSFFVADITVGYYNPMYFINNILKDNLSLSGICRFSNLVLTDQQLLKIHHNDFSDNEANEIINIVGDNNNANLNFVYMKFNNFQDPNSQYELYNSIPYGAPDIYADGNYWGTTNTQHIDSVIYDYFDFANQSVVYYLPVLSEAVVIDSTCSPIQTGINNLDILSINSGIVLYPNPVSEDLNLQLQDKNDKISELSVTNTLGQKVAEQKVKGNDAGKITVTLKSLPPGVYFLRVETEKKILTGKIIKE
ncbi:MAG TPA: T9SS type A sorting domain-containing protein [Chitinophagales bacterium]|nr:T9SS type A sorting domain-containing protein [Chitinophagales bacterium]